MAKPTIGYALVKRVYGGFEVMAITSESYGQLHGRLIPENVLSHKAKRDIFHRFDEGTTEEIALAAMGRYRAEYERLTPAVEAAQKTLEQAQRTRSYAAMDAAKCAQ